MCAVMDGTTKRRGKLACAQLDLQLGPQLGPPLGPPLGPLRGEVE